MKKVIFYSLLLVTLVCCKSNASRDNLTKAEVLSFNAEDCMCCWGWTLKVGNDTIKCEDTKLGEIVGFTITKPVTVYVELGGINELCSKKSKFVFYELNTVSK